jgi:dTDP-4-dehydrorhamnose 3,5-epimerase
VEVHHALRHDDVIDELQRRSTFGPIDRVIAIPLKKVTNERGHLMEVLRSDDPHFPGFGQTYVTRTKAGVIKAWYRHRKQLDQIALIQGELLLVLFDARAESPTRHIVQTISITEERPLLVQIPTGVWHGFRAMGSQDAYLLHLNTRPFDAADTDEDRLAPDDPAIPYRWTE